MSKISMNYVLNNFLRETIIEGKNFAAVINELKNVWREGNNFLDFPKHLTHNTSSSWTSGKRHPQMQVAKRSHGILIRITDLLIIERTIVSVVTCPFQNGFLK